MFFAGIAGNVRSTRFIGPAKPETDRDFNRHRTLEETMVAASDRYMSDALQSLTVPDSQENGRMVDL